MVNYSFELDHFSWGWGVCFVLVWFSALYMLLGVPNSLAQGRGWIPNRSFWGALGSLVVDGLAYSLPFVSSSHQEAQTRLLANDGTDHGEICNNKTPPKGSTPSPLCGSASSTRSTANTGNRLHSVGVAGGKADRSMSTSLHHAVSNGDAVKLEHLVQVEPSNLNLGDHRQYSSRLEVYLLSDTSNTIRLSCL